MSENEIELFRKAVLGQFLAIRNAREKEVIFSRWEDEGREPAGVVNRLLHRGSMFFARKGVSLAQRKGGLAQSLISTPEIRLMICGCLANAKINEKDDDARLVNCVVQVLLDRSIAADHSITGDDELFGSCCDEISRIGITQFCSL